MALRGNDVAGVKIIASSDAGKEVGDWVAGSPGVGGPEPPWQVRVRESARLACSAANPLDFQLGWARVTIKLQRPQSARLNDDAID